MPTSWRDLLATADAALPDFRKAFVATVAAAQGSVAQGALAKALAAKDYAKAESILAAAWATAAPGWEAQLGKDVLNLLGNTGASTAATVVKGGAFDLLNPRAIKWAQDESSKLVKYVTTQQREAIRTVIGKAMGGEYTYASAARQLRTMTNAIGLDPRRATALATFGQKTLDRASKLVAAKPGWGAKRKAETLAKAQRKVDRYGARLLKSRTETIARTETLASANQGMLEAWQQQIDAKLLPPNLVKKWITTPDDRRCRVICAPMQGKMTRVDRDFDVPKVGPIPRPPAHPNCRCVMALVRPPRTNKNVQGAPPLPIPKPPKPLSPVALFVPPVATAAAPPIVGVGKPVKLWEVESLEDLTRPLDAGDLMAMGKSDAAIYLEQLELEPKWVKLLEDLEGPDYLKMNLTAVEDKALANLVSQGLVTKPQLARLQELAHLTFPKTGSAGTAAALDEIETLLDTVLSGGGTKADFVDYAWTSKQASVLEELEKSNHFIQKFGTGGIPKQNLVDDALTAIVEKAAAHPEDAFAAFYGETMKVNPLWWQTATIGPGDRVALRWALEADALMAKERKQVLLALTRDARKLSQDPLLGWTVKEADDAGSIYEMWKEALGGNPQKLISLPNDAAFRAELFKIIDDGYDDETFVRLLLRKTLDMDSAISAPVGAATPQAVVAAKPAIGVTTKGPYKTFKTAKQAQNHAPADSWLKKATIKQQADGTWVLEGNPPIASASPAAVADAKLEALLEDIYNGKLVPGMPLAAEQHVLLLDYITGNTGVSDFSKSLIDDVLKADPVSKIPLAGAPKTMGAKVLSPVSDTYRKKILDGELLPGDWIGPQAAAELADYAASLPAHYTTKTTLEKFLVAIPTKAPAQGGMTALETYNTGMTLAKQAIAGDLGPGALFGDAEWKALRKVLNEEAWSDAEIAKIKTVLRKAKPLSVPPPPSGALKTTLLDEITSGYVDDTAVFDFTEQQALKELLGEINDEVARKKIATILELPYSPKGASPVFSTATATLTKEEETLLWSDVLDDAIDPAALSPAQVAKLEEWVQKYAGKTISNENATKMSAWIAQAKGAPILAPAPASTPLPTGVAFKGPFKTAKTAKQAINHAPAGSPLKAGKVVPMVDDAGDVVAYQIEFPAFGGTAPSPAAQAVKKTTTAALPIAKPIPTSGFRPTASWVDDLMTRKVANATGSNPGGLYQTANGEKFYVKLYKDPRQGMNEVAANNIYRALGAQAPEAWTVRTGTNQVAYVSRILDNRGTVQSLGLDAARANEILDHFVADVFLQNWDAVGTGLDNVVVTTAGRIARIDQGGALAFRAQGALKPSSAFRSIDEWDSFYTRNSYYRSVFDTAGFSSADELGARAIKQIDELEAFAKAIEKKGGWRWFLESALEAAPDGPEKAGTISDLTLMLETRYKLLLKKRDELRALGAPVAPTGGPVTVVKVNTIDDALAVARTRPGAGSAFAWDGDAVEDLNVSVFGVKIANEDFVELKLKLTPSAGDDLARRMTVPTKGFKPPLRRLPPDESGLGTLDFTKTGAPFSPYETYGETFYRESGPLRFNFVRNKNASNGPFAMHNTVQIWVKGNPSAADVRKALDDVLGLGAKNVAPTIDDLTKVAENKLVAIFITDYGMGPRSWTPSMRRAALERAKKYGIGLGDVRVIVDDLGKTTFELTDAAADRLATKLKIGHFQHKLYSGARDVDEVFAQLTQSHQGMLSTVTRHTEGVGKTGMSSGEDVRTGGADYFFTRQRGDTNPTLDGGHVYFNRRLVRRLDWFAYDGDRYGAQNPLDSQYASSVRNRDTISALGTRTGNCETMFKRRISFEDVDAYVVNSQRDRQTLLNRLRAKGISKLGGKPIEQFIRVTGDRL